MPFILTALAALGLGAYAGSTTTTALSHPDAVPSGNTGAGLDLTKLAGYAIAGGLIYYFGKKIIK